MHGTTKAIFIAAAVLQANANPLFKRQASSSRAPVSSTSANLTSSYFPTATFSSPIPAPTDPTLPFPFPGGSNSTNGTYYICSFPSTNDTAPTTSAPLSTETASATATLSTVTETVSSAVPTDVFVANITTTSGSALPATTSLETTTPISTPAPTPTPFTVVGPSGTLAIECIQISGGGHPHPPPPGPGPITSSGSFLPSLPTLTRTPTSVRTAPSTSLPSTPTA
ncbi:hypothetical protein FRC07_004212 [Ceratobasidium sp. 392]|nr:hypothetical protein FRC07_004212 [Ceratobasidium sp. 392]